MRMSEPVCTFTGHRAGKLPWGYNESDPRCRKLKKTLYDTVEAVYESGRFARSRRTVRRAGGPLGRSGAGAV